jgi:hypothetical protein
VAQGPQHPACTTTCTCTRGLCVELRQLLLVTSWVLLLLLLLLL